MVEEEFTKVARGCSNFIGIGKKCRESLTTRIFFGIVNLSFLSLIRLGREMKQELTTDGIAEQDNQPEPSRNNIRGSSRIK